MADDWKIDIQSGDRVAVPSFIRLFMIKRILSSSLDGNQIATLVREIKDTTQRQVAETIVTRLINDGIKKYMENWFDEKQQVPIIELLFNQIILTKYSQEYKDIITYGIENNGNCNKKDNTNNIDKDNINDNEESEYHQRLVFNTTDLMCLIFQYIRCDAKFNGELFECSLVCSHWLYHVWNPKSIYHISLTEIVRQTLKLYIGTDDKNNLLLDGFSDSSGSVDNNNNNNNNSNNNDNKSIIVNKLINCWQRLISVKSAHCYLSNYDSNSYDYNNVNDDKYKWILFLLTKLSMLKNVIIIRFTLPQTHIPILKTILSQCSKNIVISGIKVTQLYKYDWDSSDDNDSKKTNASISQLRPLKLLNGRDIEMRSLNFFYIIWSYKCKKLRLTRLKNIDDKWIQFVIDNCDCNGIEYLHIDSSRFGLKDFYQNNAKKCNDLMKKFATRFINLNDFKITCYEDRMSWYFTLLWRYLIPFIEKNNANVTLQVTSRWDSEKFKKLNKMIQETKAKITRVDIWMYKNESLESMKQLILNPNLEYLGIDNWIKSKAGVFESMITFFKENLNISNDNDDNVKSQSSKMQQQAIANVSTFSSLKVIDFHDSNVKFETLNEFLQFISQISLVAPGLFVDIVCARGNISLKYDENTFSSLLDTLFGNIMSLLTTDQVGIHFKITFEELTTTDGLDQILNSKFESFFDKNKTLKYKRSIKNKYCQSFKIPQVSLKMSDVVGENVFDRASSDNDSDSSDDGPKKKNGELFVASGQLKN